MSLSTSISRQTLLGIALLLVPIGALLASGTIVRGSDVIFSHTVPETGQEIRITRSELERSLADAQTWFLYDFNKSGFFNYLFDPRTGKYHTGNSMVRQMLASRLLAEESGKNALLFSFHEKNLEYIFSRWYRENAKEGRGYIFFNDESVLGANGLALSVLAKSPLLETYRGKGAALAKGILDNQEESGELRTVLVRNPERSYGNELHYYYAGEAILGLFDWYQRTGEDSYLSAALKAQDFYLQKYLGPGRHNSLLFHWQILSLSRAYALTGDVKYRDGALSLSDQMAALQKVSGADPDVIGLFADPLDGDLLTFSGGTAIHAEALMHAYAMAQDLGDAARMEKYRTAIFLALHNILRLQYDAKTAEQFESPRLLGGFANGSNDPRTRVDGTQHAIDALRLAVDLF